MSEATTMKNVIGFPAEQQARDERARQQQAELERGIAADDSRLVRQREQRLERARSRLNAPGFTTKPDRARLAENLWSILDEIEKKEGIRKSVVLNAAGRAGEGGAASTKYLSRYALKPDLDPEIREKRIEELVKRPAMYVKIAEKAAALARRAKDDVLLELLEGTSFLEEGEALANPVDIPEWSRDLAAIMDRIARGVVREAGLDAHRDLASRFILSPASWPTWLPVTQVGQDLRSAPGDVVTWQRASRLLEAFPHLLIGEVQAAGAFSVEVAVEPERCRWAKSLKEPIYPLVTTAVVRLEVRLAILPFTPSGVFKAALLLRPYTLVAEASIKPADQGSTGRAGSALLEGGDPFAEPEERRVVSRGRLPGYLAAARSITTSKPSLGAWRITFRATDPDPDAAAPFADLVPSCLPDDPDRAPAPLVRIHPLAPEVVSQVLGHRDTGDISDWVGPERADNGRFELPMHEAHAAAVEAEQRPDDLTRKNAILAESDEEYEVRIEEELREEEWQEEINRRLLEQMDKEYQEEQYRVHFDTNSGDFHETLTLAPDGTLAAKLERSLLDLPEIDRPDNTLLATARRQVAELRQAVEQALRQRGERIGCLKQRWDE